MRAYAEIDFMVEDRVSDAEAYRQLYARISWHVGSTRIRRMFEVGQVPHAEIDVEAIARRQERAGKGVPA